MVVGRGTMAQTYFVIAIEAFFLMLHMRMYPFVVYKHNVIEALGHCSLMMLYAAMLILRNQSKSVWEGERFPEEGCEISQGISVCTRISVNWRHDPNLVANHSSAVDGWFIVFLFVVMLPAPSFYFLFNTKPDKTHEQTDFGKYEGNPLALDEEDGQDDSAQNAPAQPEESE